MDTSRSLTDDLLGEVAFVHRLARALVRDAGLAHDVAQDALAAAMHERTPQHLRGWLAAVARRLAGRVRRDAQERAGREAQASPPEADDREQRTNERLQLHRRLTDAVLALPEPYRTAVTLRFFDGLPPRAMARRLGLPAATVRQHVHRGLAMLRQQLDREFGGRGNWCAAFAASGLGGWAGHALTLAPVLAMKKLAVVVLVAAFAGAWWTWPSGPVAPNPATQSASATPASSASARAAGDAALPVAPRELVDAPSTTAPHFAVVVADERGQPIAGARVHRWTSTGDVQQQRTDREGRAEFTLWDGAGGLCVLANGNAPLLRELASLRGEVRCVLPDGAVLDGSMLVDGAPAPAGLRLGLDVSLVAPTGAPRAIAEALAPFLVRRAIAAITTPGGGFVFRGLAAGQRVTVALPTTHWFLPENDLASGDPDSVEGRALVPATGIVLRTTQLPTVYGRVVWADDGSPVVDPRLMVHARFADGSETPSMGCFGNDDGTFVAGFHPMASSSRLRWLQPTQRPALAMAQLSVEAKGSAGSVRVELDAGALAACPIEVRLPRAAITHFVVTDASERPIAGARVSITPSTATDGDGRGTFEGPRDRLLVGADGYQVQPATPVRGALGTDADPLHFVLAPRNRLVINVRTEQGAVPPIWWVRIESPADLFCGKRFQSEFDRSFGGGLGDCRRMGRNQPDGSIEWREYTCTLPPEPSGRFELHSLEPGLACTAIAMGALDAEVARATFVTPPAGETCSVDLVVTTTPRPVSGHVLARDGTAIPNATVVLRSGDAQVEARSGANGHFAFDAVYSRVPLEIRANVAGFAESQRFIADGDTARDVELVLEPGHRVTLRIVDDEGLPVPAGAYAETAPGRTVSPQVLQPGTHVFTDLPATVTFVSKFGGARFALVHDAANPAAVLRVPRPARIVAMAPKGESDKTSGSLRVRATPIDRTGDAVLLWLGESDLNGEPQLLLPGRYRVELVRTRAHWRPGSEVAETTTDVVAPAKEIEAKAGELVRVDF